jgi:hypothetical protein
MKRGGPVLAISPISVSATNREFIRCSTSIARHIRVNSSSTAPIVHHCPKRRCGCSALHGKPFGPMRDIAALAQLTFQRVEKRCPSFASHAPEGFLVAYRQGSVRKAGGRCKGVGETKPILRLGPVAPLKNQAQERSPKVSWGFLSGSYFLMPPLADVVVLRNPIVPAYISLPRFNNENDDEGSKDVSQNGEEKRSHERLLLGMNRKVFSWTFGLWSRINLDVGWKSIAEASACSSNIPEDLYNADLAVFSGEEAHPPS